MSWRRANNEEKQPSPYFPAGISPDRQYRGEVAHDPLVPRTGSAHVGDVKLARPCTGSHKDVNARGEVRSGFDCHHEQQAAGVGSGV